MLLDRSTRIITVGISGVKATSNAWQAVSGSPLSRLLMKVPPTPLINSGPVAALVAGPPPLEVAVAASFVPPLAPVPALVALPVAVAPPAAPAAAAAVPPVPVAPLAELPRSAAGSSAAPQLMREPSRPAVSVARSEGKGRVAWVSGIAVSYRCWAPRRANAQHSEYYRRLLEQTRSREPQSEVSPASFRIRLQPHGIVTLAFESKMRPGSAGAHVPAPAVARRVTGAGACADRIQLRHAHRVLVVCADGSVLMSDKHSCLIP
jgi:hypothetical protein